MTLNIGKSGHFLLFLVKQRLYHIKLINAGHTFYQHSINLLSVAVWIACIVILLLFPKHFSTFPICQDLVLKCGI